MVIIDPDSMEWIEPFMTNDCIDECIIDSKCKSDAVSLKSLMLLEATDISSASSGAALDFQWF